MKKLSLSPVVTLFSVYSIPYSHLSSYYSTLKKKNNNNVMLRRIHIFPFINIEYSHNFSTTNTIINSGKDYLCIQKWLGERFLISRILAESHRQFFGVKGRGTHSQWINAVNSSLIKSSQLTSPNWAKLVSCASW